MNTPGGLSTNKDLDEDNSKGPFLTSLQEPKIGEQKPGKAQVDILKHLVDKIDS